MDVTEERAKTLAALHFVRATGKCNMITEFQKALSYAYIVTKVIWGLPDFLIEDTLLYYKEGRIQATKLFSDYIVSCRYPEIVTHHLYCPGGKEWATNSTRILMDNPDKIPKFGADALDSAIEECLESFRFGRDVCNIKTLSNEYAHGMTAILTGAKLMNPDSKEEWARLLRETLLKI